MEKWALFRSTCRATSVGLSSSHCFLSRQLSKNGKCIPLQHRNVLCASKTSLSKWSMKHKERRSAIFFPRGSPATCSVHADIRGLVAGTPALTGLVTDIPVPLQTGRHWCFPRRAVTLGPALGAVLVPAVLVGTHVRTRCDL